jgi:uncharacterized protein
MNETDRVLRQGYRNSRSRSESSVAVNTAEIEGRAIPTSNLFKRGDRICVDISSRNFSHFAVNPNAGAPEGSAGERAIAQNTFLHDMSRS